MDFYSLSRKELQALCKKNKIPANITNIAMADALAALPQVEGLDEIMNPSEVVAGTPCIQHRTASRTSTLRKAVKEPESSKVSTRFNRGKGTGVAEGVVEQENKDANVSATPAMVPSSRRKVPAVSTRRKKEVVILDDGDEDDDKNGVLGKAVDVPKTPAVAPSSRKRATGRSVCNKNETPIGTSVQSQRAYSTRRSVRLLGKSLSEMSLVESEDIGLSKIDDDSEELSMVSQDVEDSLDIEKGASLQTVSTEVSENTEELEVSSLNKDVNECQSHDSGSEVKSVSGKENEAEDELQAEPQEEGSGNDYHVEAEPQDSSLNLQGSFDACDDNSNAAGSEQPELEDSCDSAELENKECNGTEQEALSVELSEEASMETADQAIFPFDACDDSNEAGSEQPGGEESCDSAKLENKECFGTEQDALSVEVSEEASMEIADQVIASLSVEASEESVEASEEVKDASVSLKELVEGNIDNQDSNGGDDDDQENKNVTEHLNVADGVQKFEHDDVDEQAADKKDMSSFEGVLELGSGEHQQDGIQKFEHDDVDEQAADKKDMWSFEGVIELGSGEHQQEVLEPKPEHSEESSAEIEKMEYTSDVTGVSSAILAEKDESSGNSGAENEGCIESFADEKGSMEVEKVTHQLSLLGVVVTEAEDQKDPTDKQEAEESEAGMRNPKMMKENLTTVDFHGKSIRELKKMLKNLNSKTNDAGHMQEVEKKRTALQTLPQNVLPTGEAQIDG